MHSFYVCAGMQRYCPYTCPLRLDRLNYCHFIHIPNVSRAVCGSLFIFVTFVPLHHAGFSYCLKMVNDQPECRNSLSTLYQSVVCNLTKVKPLLCCLILQKPYSQSKRCMLYMACNIWSDNPLLINAVLPRVAISNTTGHYNYYINYTKSKLLCNLLPAERNTPVCLFVLRDNIFG